MVFPVKNHVTHPTNFSGHLGSKDSGWRPLRFNRISSEMDSWTQIDTWPLAGDSTCNN